MGGAQVQPPKSTPPKRFGPLKRGGGGSWAGVSGTDNFFMFYIHIWIPHAILSMLRRHTWDKNENLSPTICQKEFSGAFGTKCGRELLNILATLKGRGCRRQGLHWAPPPPPTMSTFLKSNSNCHRLVINRHWSTEDHTGP